MGYLLAFFIGFALGWLSAALFISSSRAKIRPAAGKGKTTPGVDPICESCQLMGKI